jgi:hypothetical protein
MPTKATKRLEELLAVRANAAAAHCTKPPPNKPQP